MLLRFNFQSHIYSYRFTFQSTRTTMSGCTLRLSKDSPVRTTLVDEASGHAKYQIDTPIKIAGSVTRIRKFDSITQPPLHWDQDVESDSGQDITNAKGKSKSKSKSKSGSKEEEGGGDGTTELPETSDEMARIYWKWFSSDRIVFRGRVASRTDFLPKTGKVKG